MNVSAYGAAHILGGYHDVGGVLSCLGDGAIPANGSGCWAVQNTLSGCASNGNCIALDSAGPNQAVSGNSTGNYYGNIMQNGAQYNRQSPQQGQLTVPYCNGGTCNTTGWLQVPPTP